MIKFTERYDALSFCLIKAICALALKDGAFRSRWIRTPEDIYKTEIPDNLQSVPLAFARRWQKVPILRRSTRDATGNTRASPTLAAQYSTMAKWNGRLGRSFGMKEPFEFKMLRRAAAAVLPGTRHFVRSLERY
jgi:Protein of unknown function (DUF3435)